MSGAHPTRGEGRGAAPRSRATAYASFHASQTEPPWPEQLGGAALQGLAGDFVRLVDPHTEADPAALLFQFLVGFGNVVGRHRYFFAENDRHYVNLFVALVGETAKARKGTSWGHVSRQLSVVDGSWFNERVMSGLSSGEGLIWQVRDPISKREPVREKRRVVDYQEVEADAGIEDKRLLIMEPELASVLRAMSRDGSTLSPTMRQGWDSGRLRTLTKNAPAQATDAHISIVGHITRDELRRYLERTEMGNGLANRFLWACARRSKVLPEGGRIEEVDFAQFQRRLDVAVRSAQQEGEIRRDAEARELWIDVYERLSEGRPGLLGAVTSRGEAQVMRLACVYALLDDSRAIRRVHLGAALEVWRYAYDSACHVFGAGLGDPKADEALVLIRARPDGISRSELGQQLFGKHRRDGFDRVLDLLRSSGLAEPWTESTEGRSVEIWSATHRGGKGVHGGKGSASPAPAEPFAPFPPFTPSGDEGGDTSPDEDEVWGEV